MKKLIAVVLLSTSFLFVLRAGTILPSLEEKITNQPNGSFRVQIHLTKQASADIDIKQLDEIPIRLLQTQSKEYRQHLKNLSEESQKDVLEFLKNRTQNSNIRSFWICNRIIATLPSDVIKILATRSDVQYISENYQRNLAISGPLQPTNWINQNGNLWNILLIRALHVWKKGITGKGVDIAFIDTGVDALHADIRPNLRSYDYWYDAIEGARFPYDIMGHGTHCSGIAAATHRIGVAPGAKIIMTVAFNPGGSGWDEDILECFQWLVDLDDPPDIISNSWSGGPADDLTYWETMVNLRKMGIIPVFASGNGGPNNSQIPANYPLVIGVGAIDSLDRITDWSSGCLAPNKPPWNDPQNWSRKDWQLIKPDISAPGDNVASCFPGGGYAIANGTSMSCPHIAGVIALILEKNPNATYKEIYDRLLTYSEQRPDVKYPNTRYGWGRVNAWAAVFKTFGVEESQKTKPKTFKLTASPNPIKSSSNFTISYQIPKSEYISLKIYDGTGSLVRTLQESRRTNGSYKTLWNLKNDSGQKVPAGIYFCRLETSGQTEQVKIIFLD